MVWKASDVILIIAHVCDPVKVQIFLHYCVIFLNSI